MLSKVCAKLDILGETVCFMEKRMKAKSSSLIIICFFLYKKLYVERARMEDALTSGENIFDINLWEEF